MAEETSKEVRGLVIELLDNTAREDERHDAAMDLGEYDSDEAISALAKVASDPNEEDIIVDSCAESMAEIWVRMNKFNEYLFKKLSPLAKNIISKLILSKNPTLIARVVKDQISNEMQ